MGRGEWPIRSRTVEVRLAEKHRPIAIETDLAAAGFEGMFTLKEMCTQV
jgi:hypothetical protein